MKRYLDKSLAVVPIELMFQSGISGNGGPNAVDASATDFVHH
jgi:hypothetical protein